jgi:hypothetical protein
VVIDDLDRPLGILELHLLFVVARMGNVLLAFPLVGRCAIVVGLFHELLDLLALLSNVAPGVVHRALWPALIAAGGLAQSLVTAWAVAPHQSLQRQQ